MDSLKLLQRLKREHDYYNRCFTLSLAAALCLLGLVLWWAEVPLLDEHKVVVGLVMIFLAVVFYNIPYLVYRLLRRRYRDDATLAKLIGTRWYFYRVNIMNRQI